MQLIDTYTVLILVHMAFGLPFAVWLMRGFFAEIPRELDQAAMLDGYSYLAVLRKIIIPLATPSIAVTAIFTFIFSWNEFLLALLADGHERRHRPRADLQDDPGVPGALG